MFCKKVAAIVAMIFTWIKNGAPDVSMSLNGSLAGLVVCVAVLMIENKIKTDDPVGL